MESQEAAETPSLGYVHAESGPLKPKRWTRCARSFSWPFAGCKHFRLCNARVLSLSIVIHMICDHDHARVHKSFGSTWFNNVVLTQAKIGMVELQWCPKILGVPTQYVSFEDFRLSQVLVCLGVRSSPKKRKHLGICRCFHHPLGMARRKGKPKQTMPAAHLMKVPETLQLIICGQLS